ncbi:MULTISPECIES: trypsin-like peptidase domain-containing protein [unclassified Streptococcus]|uniref:trypsin-like peptidase domain-containing protein n=1 Tax=unclassified Streptococcus TaxID=2608887 RepID=UPI0015630BE5|nr:MULTISPECIES: trypsin-like peptidase domain-containing protein [unclassified Streptococcus]
MFVYLKGLGKFRKSKAYGLVGCLALVSMIGLSIPDLPVVGGRTVYADVIQGGDDIKDVDVHSKSAEGVAMTYTTYDSGTSGKQTASGSGVFVAPNVMVTVAHNYYDKNQEDKSAVLRGGESARSYVVMNSEKEKSNKVPTSGVSESLEKDSIHLYNGKDFGKDYSNDLAVVVTKKPVEAMTGGEDSPRELSDKEVSTGDKITMVGYPNDFSTPNLSEENKKRLQDGKAYSVSTTVSSINKESGAVTYHSSALGGFSGAPLFNDKGEVVGIHQHGTNTPNAQESERSGGGTIFTDKHRAWIRSMIDQYGITGWFVDGSTRYYYDENHRALKDVESEIDGAVYHFDEKGRATLVKGEEKGRVLLRVEDTKGTPLISDKVVQEGPVGSGLNFHLRQNSDFKQLIATSPTAKVVSYNGVSVNKLASDTSWSDEYVSKLALGNTIIKAVVDSVNPSSTSSSDFARTEVGKVDLSGKSNLPVPSKEVLQAPNGSENFYATTHIQTPDGSGSGTLIAPNLVLTVAHNFLTVKGSEVVTKSGRTNTVYKVTLPNGDSMNFSDDDIVYWNKKDSVFGFKNDLALVRLKEKFKAVSPVEVVSESTSVAKGEKVSVYGFPDGRLSPVLDSEVVGTTDFGSGIEGISYEGTKPGASGGGLYNDKGALIGVHQNGVVGSRSGGLVLSKEQLDWVRSYIEGQPKDPVYVKDEVLVDEKDKDKLPSTPKDEKPSTSNLESDKDKTSTSFKPQEEPKTEVITTYEGDSTLEVGKERTEDTKGEKEGVPLIYRVVYKGTQPKVEKESIAFDTLYQGDETKELGFRSIVEGKEGLVTRTTTYQVDKYTGAIFSKIFEEKVAPQSQVITLGIKQNSSTKEVPITERFEDSTELEKGKTEVLSEGSVGKEVTTVTYKVLPDGKVVENSRTVEVTPMRERVVRKGVKEVVSPDKVESLVPKDAPTREELPVFSEGFSESEVLVSGEKTQGDLGKSIVSSKELVPERVKVPDFVAKVTGGEKLTVEGHRDESKINTPSKQERLSSPETTAQFTTNGTGSSSLTAVFGVEADNRSLSTVEHSVITYNQQRGWHKINNQWYFRNSDGKERTGWMKENDVWYYFDTNGTMQTGWLEDTDGNWYYLNDNGRMEIGWFQDSSGAWYYLGSSGRMESNTWIYYKGKWYYIDALGKLLFNSVTPDGYRVNEYGEWIN